MTTNTINLDRLTNKLNSVNDVINSIVDEYDKLNQHSNNQRIALTAQNKDIKKLKDSLAFDDCVVALDNDTVNSLNVKNCKLSKQNYEYKARYKAIKKTNANHLGKLIELEHILNRDDSSMEFH